MFSRDPIFNDPRLAVLYDEFDNDRSDLDVYVKLIVDELKATSVLDVGCGTGSLAMLLADKGLAVVGVDPAIASLEIAKRKDDLERVHWITGVLGEVPAAELGREFDLAVMTGNVAQVFLEDGDWATTLNEIAAVVRPGGHLVFETRDPAKQAWLGWQAGMRTSERTVAGIGVVAQSTELVSVELPFVSFRHKYDFAETGETLSSDSTLRFRTKAEITETLEQAGFLVHEIRDAPDRPGLEFVFVARRLAATS